MTSSKKSQLVIVLILAFAWVTALSAEADETKAKLKFETSNEEQSWHDSSGKCCGKGLIKPTHVAELFASRYTNRHDEILKTAAGLSMSQLQREFLKTTQDAFSTIGSTGDMVRGHYHARLYAVSSEDAKKMVEAFIEFLTNRAKERVQKSENLLYELEGKISQAKKELPRKDARLGVIKARYKKIKERTHKLSSDSDAAKEAKETILEMNRMLDVLNIEIEGIEAKLSAIAEYKTKKNVSIEGLAKLEQIQSEQTIELAGALARKQAALRIRAREEEFYNLFKQCDDVARQVYELREDLGSYEGRLERVKDKLANPRRDMLPPSVYQNKATIYPVRVD